MKPITPNYLENISIHSEYVCLDLSQFRENDDIYGGICQNMSVGAVTGKKLKYYSGEIKRIKREGRAAGCVEE